MTHPPPGPARGASSAGRPPTGPTGRRRPAPPGRRGTPACPGRAWRTSRRAGASGREPRPDAPRRELAGFQGRVVVDLAEERLHVGDRPVRERMPQRRPRRRQVDRLVDRADPPAGVAAEEPERAVVLRAREPERAAQDDAPDRHAVAGVRPARDRARGPRRPARAWPARRRRRRRPSRPRPASSAAFRWPAKSSNARTTTRSACCAGDRLGLVAAGGVDDDDPLVGPGERREAGRQVLGLVPGEDQGGDGGAGVGFTKARRSTTRVPRGDRPGSQPACRTAFRAAIAAVRAGK